MHMTLLAIKHAFGDRWKWLLDSEPCFDTITSLRNIFGQSEKVAYDIALLFPESYRPRVIKRWRARSLDAHAFVHDLEMRYHDMESFVEYWTNVNPTKPNTYARAHSQAVSSLLLDHKVDMSDSLLVARLRLHMWFFWRLDLPSNHIKVSESPEDGRVRVDVYSDVAHPPVTVYHEVPSYG